MKSLLPTSRGESGPFRALRNGIERALTGSSADAPVPFTFGVRRFPALQIEETGDAVDVSVELPGVDRADIDVSVVGRSLVIAGEKKAESERSASGYGLDRYVAERLYGSFRRVVPLGFAVDADMLETSFDNGLLKVHVARPPETVDGDLRTAA